MPTQNTGLKAVLPLSLFLLSTVTACGEPSSETGDRDSENAQATVETSEEASDSKT
ncbi:MAG: hypothetical protein F6J95_015305 [Leptolyngbya sp. SIO1E4]|nr:hypothetical protein [Leptolyngbya sp. SIO1E4]